MWLYTHGRGKRSKIKAKDFFQLDIHSTHSASHYDMSAGQQCGAHTNPCSHKHRTNALWIAEKPHLKTLKKSTLSQLI